MSGVAVRAEVVNRRSGIGPRQGVLCVFMTEVRFRESIGVGDGDLDLTSTGKDDAPADAADR